jgi:nicotinamide riboside transporter PnuC
MRGFRTCEDKMIELFGTLSTILAITGVWFNNRKMIVCFYIWLISNSISLVIHLHSGIYSLAARDFIFLILAFEGISKWSKK